MYMIIYHSDIQIVSSNVMPLEVSLIRVFIIVLGLVYDYSVNTVSCMNIILSWLAADINPDTRRLINVSK